MEILSFEENLLDVFRVTSLSQPQDSDLLILLTWINLESLVERCIRSSFFFLSKADPRVTPGVWLCRCLQMQGTLTVTKRRTSP